MLDQTGLRGFLSVLRPAAYYVLTVVACLPPGLRPVLARTCSVATGVPTAMDGAPRRGSSPLPDLAVPLSSFLNEFGQMDLGSPTRHQWAVSEGSLDAAHKAVPESRAGRVPPANGCQIDRDTSNGGHRSESISVWGPVPTRGGSSHAAASPGLAQMGTRLAK